MKTKYFIFAASALVALASCSNEEYIGDNSLTSAEGDGSIQFSYTMPNATRGDIVGSGAASLLGNGFYVVGTKGTEQETTPSTKLVFDNYLVHYGANTAGTTESNTANWEYAGITPGMGSYTNWVKLSALSAQTIKYWDYSEAQYDFLAFSTGTKKAVAKTAFTGETSVAVQNDEIGVTAMRYGEYLDDGAAYTFYIPTTEGLQNTYITDVITVAKANYGNEVKLTFKNLGSKIRLALYETVPGYSVKEVKFYATVGIATPTDLGSETSTTATLISADGTYGFSTKGTAVVSFPKLGTNNKTDGNYKKASVEITPVNPSPADPTLTQTFGTLDYKKDKEGSETAGTIYLGRNVTEVTYAGKSAVDYYQVVFPVTNSKPLTLRVDYTLVSTDGSGEEIKVYGAKAVVPSTYTVWQPNYAYTYIFKISDNTNGWTSTDATKDAGLFPITFDAVVAEVKEVSGEQRTITTVSTPSITTYQQKHDKAKDEYSQTSPADKDIYVQVMDNSTVPATLIATLNGTTSESTARSLLYLLSDDDATEAEVMDALENRTSELATANVTGRNGLTLTNDATNIDATVTQILNGADDKPITQIEGAAITAGKVVKLDISGLTAGKTYAYVYDYSDAAKTTKSFYQPTGATGTLASGVKYITKAALDGIAYDSNKTSSEAANDDYIYFSKTTTDGVNYTYSYYSVDGKQVGNLPDGLLKVAKTALSTSDGGDSATASDFVFDIYKRNTGKYAVKVIKIVA